MSTDIPETAGTIDQVTMGLSGLAIALGVVAWPPLIAFGLLVLALYAVYELVTPKRPESREPTAGSPMR